MTGLAVDGDLNAGISGITQRRRSEIGTPPFPINLKRVRRAMKIIGRSIGRTQGVHLLEPAEAWASRFGKITSVRIDALRTRSAFATTLRAAIDPEKVGMRVLRRARKRSRRPRVRPIR